MEIEKNVPMPPQLPATGPRVGVTRVFSRMEVGDSILIEDPKDLNSVVCFARRNGMKARYRKGVGGWRVWRAE